MLCDEWTPAQVKAFRLTVNRVLPPGDRGRRSGDSSGSPGSAGIVSGAVGLVGGVADPPERETPPGGSPAARHGGKRLPSGVQRIAALAVLALCGRDCQPHLLSHSARQESTEGMRLPVRQLQQLFGGRSAGSLKQFEDRRGFTAFPDVVSCAPGRFLLRAGLLPRLDLGGRKRWRDVRQRWPFWWAWSQ
jgi:hypothetical protein